MQSDDKSAPILQGSAQAREPVQADPDAIRPAPPPLTFMAAPHVTLHDVKRSTFLWPVASQIEVGHVVEVLHENHAFLVRLYVYEIDLTAEEVRCHVIAEHDWRRLN